MSSLQKSHAKQAGTATIRPAEEQDEIDRSKCHSSIEDGKLLTQHGRLQIRSRYCGQPSLDVQISRSHSRQPAYMASRPLVSFVLTADLVARLIAILHFLSSDIIRLRTCPRQLPGQLVLVCFVVPAVWKSGSPCLIALCTHHPLSVNSKLATT